MLPEPFSRASHLDFSVCLIKTLMRMLRDQNTLCPSISSHPGLAVSSFRRAIREGGGGGSMSAKHEQNPPRQYSLVNKPGDKCVVGANWINFNGLQART